MLKFEDTSDKIILFGIFVIICFIPFAYIEAYVKANSSAQTQICGEVVQVYQKGEFNG